MSFYIVSLLLLFDMFFTLSLDALFREMVHLHSSFGVNRVIKRLVQAEV